MSEHNPIQQLALEVAAMRRDLAGMARIRGDRLTRAEVCERLCVHRNTLPRYIADKGFPTPCRDGTWLLAEIMEWEAQR